MLLNVCYICYMLVKKIISDCELLRLENILFLHLRYVSDSTKVSGLSLDNCSPLLGQNPYLVSVSKLAVVAHQRYPSVRPSVVHELYVTP